MSRLYRCSAFSIILLPFLLACGSQDSPQSPADSYEFVTSNSIPNETPLPTLGVFDNSLDRAKWQFKETVGHADVFANTTLSTCSVHVIIMGEAATETVEKEKQQIGTNQYFVTHEIEGGQRVATWFCGPPQECLRVVYSESVREACYEAARDIVLKYEQKNQTNIDPNEAVQPMPTRGPG